MDMFSRPEKYCILQKSWKEIDEDLARSAKLLPKPLGEQVRFIKDIKKAAQWKTWAHLLSPNLLRGRLPKPCFSTEHQNIRFAQVLFFFSVSVETTGHDVVYLLLL